MSGIDKDLQCRELIAKAVCGKGQKYSTTTQTILPSHTPSTILGCWLINNSFQAEKVGDAIEITGTCDVNLWYSFADNTQTEVKKETISYHETVPLSYYDTNCRGDLEIIARAVEQPKCVKAEISGGGTVTIRIEMEYAVEIIGETKMCVVVCSGGCDDKDFIIDDFSDSSEDYDDFESADALFDDLD
ncbi:outer spore coat protein CotE [Brevibacillus massiliensis]|jgi:spore coat protein E|uniref:outer spore coat protein CotE n=1 Tax=Brevibacillus massiliensis TaxID=1118054 RepID=UPI0002FC45A1|nr:outer spore coat protein CotE [Brevibacillus massiliensis]